ncbi:MAG: hypothetical protein ACRD8Z_22655, partial [Nitrososphaeraceae archaeon]
CRTLSRVTIISIASHVTVIVLSRIIIMPFSITTTITAVALSRSGAFFPLIKLLPSDDIFEHTSTNSANNYTLRNNYQVFYDTRV